MEAVGILERAEQLARSRKREAEALSKAAEAAKLDVAKGRHTASEASRMAVASAKMAETHEQTVSKLAKAVEGVHRKS